MLLYQIKANIALNICFYLVIQPNQPGMPFVSVVVENATANVGDCQNSQCLTYLFHPWSVPSICYINLQFKYPMYHVPCTIQNFSLTVFPRVKASHFKMIDRCLNGVTVYCDSRLLTPFLSFWHPQLPRRLRNPRVRWLGHGGLRHPSTTA